MLKAMRRLVCGVMILGLAGVAQAQCRNSKNENSDPRYECQGGGDTVYDKKTDRTWKRCPVGQRWENGWCFSNSGGAFPPLFTLGQAKKLKEPNGGWRLPTKDELLTLKTTATYPPKIDGVAFPWAFDSAIGFWSSTERTSDVGLLYAVRVCFDNKDPAFELGDSSFGTGSWNYVRLVRTGK